MTMSGDDADPMTRRKKARAERAAISPFHDPMQWIAENKHAFAIRDAYPLSEGHTLVVPKRAMATTTTLSETELLACFELVERIKEELTAKNSAEGFNIGINEGKTAGQTIDQLHIHVIPRYRGDVIDPVGGIRNIFPGQGDYLSGEKKR